jgi:hypothetical protein
MKVALPGVLLTMLEFWVLSQKSSATFRPKPAIMAMSRKVDSSKSGFHASPVYIKRSRVLGLEDEGRSGCHATRKRLSAGYAPRCAAVASSALRTAIGNS